MSVLKYVEKMYSEKRTDHVVDFESFQQKQNINNNNNNINLFIKATLSTNDIVINKLTQILTYLRAGSRNKKKKKVEYKEELMN